MQNRKARSIYLWKLILIIIAIFVIAISLECFLLIERKVKDIFSVNTSEYTSSQTIEQDNKTGNSESTDNTNSNEGINLLAISSTTKEIQVDWYLGFDNNYWETNKIQCYVDNNDENIVYIPYETIAEKMFSGISYLFYNTQGHNVITPKKQCIVELVNGKKYVKLVLNGSNDCNIFLLQDMPSDIDDSGGGGNTNSVVVFDGTNGEIYNDSQNTTIEFNPETGKATIPTSEYFSREKFNLVGWYDITNNNYYDSSYFGKEVTTTENAIFYADWIPNNYNNGTTEKGKIESADTEGLVNISLFDYNELFNISKCNYNSGSWAMNDIQNGFVLVDGRYNNTLAKPNGSSIGETVSSWTGNSTPYQGILEKDSTLLTELFDESGNTPGVHYLGKADGLFYLNDKGYYEYDSSMHMSSYNQENQSFVLYDSAQSIYNGSIFPGSFLPLNGEDPTYYSDTINYWFGMKTEITFNLEADTGTGKNLYNGEDIIFNFSGDDDTWIFIDDELVLDIGGIHDACSGTINFNTGECFINEQKQANSISLSAGVHSLKVYYMERGTGGSNLRISFCSALLEQATSLKKEVNKELVDYSENIIYTLKYENTGKNDINKSYGYDIFPFNGGIHGTVANGKMYLEKLVSNHASIDSSATLKIYYSTIEGKFLQKLIGNYGLDDQTGSKIEEMLEKGYLSEDNKEIVIQNSNSANLTKIFEYLGTLDNNNTSLTNENKEITCIYIVAENFKKASKLSLDCYMKINDGGERIDIFGDRYFNKAFSIIANNKATEYDESNVVSTTVISRSISGMVWNDENANGIREENEKPIEGVVATLLKYNQETSSYMVCENDIRGNKIDPITTTQDGIYEFDKLPAGEYIVAFNTNSNNYLITKYQVNGKNDENTNDGIKADNIEGYDFAIKYSLEQDNMKLHITDELSEDMLDNYKEKIANQDLGLCKTEEVIKLPVTGGTGTIYFIAIGIIIMLISGNLICNNKKSEK